MCEMGGECARDRLRENESQLQRFTIGDEKKKKNRSKSNVKSFELCADEEKKKIMLENIGQWCVVS